MRTLLFFLFCVVVAAQLCPPQPNWYTQLQAAYDLTSMDVFAASSSPGSRSILELTCSTNATWYDSFLNQTFLLPDQIDSIITNSGSFLAATTIASLSIVDYQQQLAETWKIDKDYLFGSFTASASFESAFSFIFTQARFAAAVTSSIESYQVQTIAPFPGRLRLTRQARSDYDYIIGSNPVFGPTTVDNYNLFFKYYGQFFMTSAQLGGNAVAQLFTSATEAMAEGSAAFFANLYADFVQTFSSMGAPSGGISGATQQFIEATIRTFNLRGGAYNPPPWSQWVNSIPLNPEINQATFAPISMLFSNETESSNMQRAVQNYMDLAALNNMIIPGLTTMISRNFNVIISGDTSCSTPPGGCIMKKNCGCQDIQYNCICQSCVGDHANSTENHPTNPEESCQLTACFAGAPYPPSLTELTESVETALSALSSKAQSLLATATEMVLSKIVDHSKTLLVVAEFAEIAATVGSEQVTSVCQFLIYPPGSWVCAVGPDCGYCCPQTDSYEVNGSVSYPLALL